MSISIAFAGEDNTYGPVMAVLVNTNPNFFRKWSFLKLKPKNKLELNKTVETSRKYLDEFQVMKIEPAELAKVDMKVAKTKVIVQLLNTQHEFWKEDITLPCPYTDPEPFYSEQEQFFMEFTKMAPSNLRQRGFNFYKWGLNKDTKTQQLAQCFADYYLDKEIQDIKNVWEVDGAIQPDCPYIRKANPAEPPENPNLKLGGHK